MQNDWRNIEYDKKKHIESLRMVTNITYLKKSKKLYVAINVNRKNNKE